MAALARLLLPRLLCCALLLPALVACGKKGPVRPLSELSPAAPPAFSAVQAGESVLLSWDMPRTNQDGSPLEDLTGFRIYRLGFAPGDPCPECREESAALVAELDLDYLPTASRRGEHLFWFDTQARQGGGYLYRILPLNRKGRPGAAARTQLILAEPPPAPEQLTAGGHDRLVRLRWNPVASLPEDAVFLGYQIYRRSGEAHFSPAPLTDEPLQTTEFEDFGVINGQSYAYAVRTLVERGGRRILSARSMEVSVIPVPGR
ncbi:fibronectin type III domain-containing protein [Geoalkalibacter sp.]|jgi:hypothetical protein|uniref:fibronectin type III domain-containing protein n=1 Tax=Geoalkalibacter sp. TaxID=3041440 RepID=UPI00272E1456|nr:hypothetical protein [Geoalkalibacter sp.]